VQTLTLDGFLLNINAIFTESSTNNYYLDYCEQNEVKFE